MTDTRIEIRPLPAALGAVVRCDNISGLDPEDRALIKRAWLDHLILVFPGQSLTRDEQINITRIFGEYEDAVAYGEKTKGVLLVSNQPGGELGAGELRWHSDQSFNEKPASASLLHAIEIPPIGGNTWFNNMYVAWDTLPTELRKAVSGRTIKNDGSQDSAGGVRPGRARVTDILGYIGPSHPIIRTHPETGNNSLYLGRRPNAYINGLPLEESESVLDELWLHATRSEAAHCHVWHVGDLLVWDNRAVMHRRDAFDETQCRILHRTQCAGELPLYDPAAESRGSHPRAGLKH